jgi:uncharacterized protein YjdB
MSKAPRATRWVGLSLIATSLAAVACQQAVRITFEPDELSFREAGATTLITATAVDRKGARVEGAVVNFSSQVPEVASVSPGGLVTAVGYGTTNIVMQVGTSDLIEFVPVAVRLPDHMEVRPGSTTCYIGNSKLIKATVYDRGNKAYEATKVEWSTSNPSIATVDQRGEVVGMGEGDVIITARALGLEGQSSISVSWNPQSKAEINAAKRGGGGGGGGGKSSKSSGDGFSDPRLGIFDD